MSMSKTGDIIEQLRDFYVSDFPEALNRSLSRVMTHAAARSIGIISANRTANSPAENNRARHELQRDIQSAGYGYAHVKGVGQEDSEAVSEPSLLVIGHEGDDKGKLKKDLVRLGQKHGQFAVLHKQHGEDNAKLVYTNQDALGKEDDLGKFHANDTTAKFFTRLKGKDKRFSFGDQMVVYLEPRGFFVRGPMLYA